MKYEIMFGLAVLMLVAGCTQPDVEPEEKTVVDIPKFSSCSAIAAEFKKAEGRGYYGFEGEVAVPLMTADAAGAAKSANYESAPDYSETNVQVEGVDEADIVKTDGEYIYVISNNRLHIVEAYPAEDAELVSSLELEDVYPVEMFIDGDTVLVFGQQRYYYGYEGEVAYDYYYPRGDSTVILMIDVSDREDPGVIREVEFEGYYLSSRKIDSTAYFVLRKWQYEVPEDPGEIVPLYRDSNEEDEFSQVCGCGDVGYLPPVEAGSFVIIGAIDMEDEDAEITKEVVVASGENVYASEENLYVAEVEYDYGPVPMVERALGYYESSEKTIVHKFSLDGQDIDYLGSMEAPGRILNQFSMDEYDGYFRIATTVGHVSRSGESASMNNVYVFGEDLEMAGELEDLAPGERIYSARFMGERAYLVTFKKVDPLFVIDLSDPEEPEVLGKLKIPGYSDYLHPLDEDHIIGIGKDTIEAEEGNFAWYQGLKMAVFDVSDVEHPKELHKVVIGDRGTDSYALYDHKAFLYDAERELLVIPVLLAEIDEEQYSGDVPDYAYGDYVFQGAYVYDLTVEDGFDLRGRITHMEDDDFDKYGYYYYDYGYAIKRSLYIGDALYTVSDNVVQANSLDDLGQIASVELPDG